MINTKLLLLTLSSSTLLVLTACGGGSSNTPASNPVTTSSSSIVPKKINIDIPDGLKNSRSTPSNKTSFQKANENVPSHGYEMLKFSILEAEERIKNIKHNMVYLSSIMSDIQTECNSVSLNTQCTIPAGKISLTITDEINQEIAQINEGFEATEEDSPPVNTTLTLGQVLYTKFDGNHTYQHHVVLDLQPIFSDFDATITKELETVKWSDDNNSVQTISDYGDEYSTYRMQLIYTKDSKSGVESMNISDSFKELESSFSGNYSLGLKNLNDSNNTFQITTTGQFISDSIKDNFNTKGQIADNGGFLTSGGSYGGFLPSDGSFHDVQYGEKETFDKNGNILKSIYCNDFNDTCNISDELTWHTFDENFGIDFDYSDSNESDEGFYTDFNGTFIADDVYYNSSLEEQSLAVIGGNIPEGICDLLPPTFDTTNVANGVGILENSIGNIFKYDNTIEGVLYDTKYVETLDTIKIVCLKPTKDGLDIALTELIGTEKPTLTLLNK